MMFLELEKVLPMGWNFFFCRTFGTYFYRTVIIYKKMLSRVMDSAFFVLFLCDLRFAEVVDAVLEGFDFGFGIGLFFALVFDDFGFGIGYEFFVAELFHYRI